MKIAILSRQPDLYANHRLLAAAAARGWHAVVVDPLHGRIASEAANRGQSEIEPLYEGIEAVIPRYGPFWQRQVHAFLKGLQGRGVRSLNDADAIALARDAPACLQAFADAGLPFPKSMSVQTGPLYPDWLDRLPFAFPMLLKRQYSSQGLGVALHHDSAELSRQALLLIDQQEPFLLQEFIAEAQGCDLRLMVVGGKVVAAMQRTARPGEFRANMHLGGSARPWHAPPEIADLAVNAARAVGLQVGGVDIIQAATGPLLLEINACPGFEALERVSGIDVAGKLLDLLNPVR